MNIASQECDWIELKGGKELKCYREAVEYRRQTGYLCDTHLRLFLKNERRKKLLGILRSVRIWVIVIVASMALVAGAGFLSEYIETWIRNLRN